MSDLSPFAEPLSRRGFLLRLAVLTGAPAVLTACGGGENGGSGGGAPGVPIADATTCRGYDPASASVRESLRYTDVTPNPEQYCRNCRFYTVPARESDPCGTCQVIPGVSGQGPVSPGGYCTSWAALAT